MGVASLNLFFLSSAYRFLPFLSFSLSRTHVNYQNMNLYLAFDFQGKAIAAKPTDRIFKYLIILILNNTASD